MRTGTRVARAAGIADDEVRSIVLVALVFATLEAGRGLGEVGVNTLVLSRLPADALPYLYIALGLISLVIAVVYGAALGRVDRVRLFGATLLGIAGLLVLERLALALDPAGVLPVVWLTVTAAGTIAVTIAWTVAASTFDARQAKRLFPMCTAAAIAGNFAGSLAAGPIAAVVATESLIALEALLFIGAAAVIARLGRSSTGAGWVPLARARRPVVADVRMGFDEVGRSPLLRLVAIAYVLFAVLMFSVSFPFLRAAHTAFPDEAQLATALGTLSAIVAATSFVVSLGVANRFYARFGVAAAALVLPLVYLAGFGLWIVHFSFLTAALVVIVQQVTQRGLANAAWSAFYNVVPAGRRAQVLAFNDGVPGQIGTVLSGVLLLTAGRLLAPDQVFWLGLGTAAACAAVVVAIRRRYAESLLRTLRAGIGEQVLEGGPGLGDLARAADVRDALIAALAAPEASVREMAASMLAGSGAPEAVDALSGALDDAEPAVRGAAACALLQQTVAGRAKERDRAEEVVQGLMSGDEASCVAGLHALRRLGRGLPTNGRGRWLDDPAPAVRAAAMAVLAAAPDPSAAATLIAALEDPAAMVRRAAADALASRRALAPGLVDLLETGSPDGQEAALRAMDGHGPEVRDIVLAWAERCITRATSLAEARRLMLAEADEDRGAEAAERDLAFLAAVLARRVERHQDLALGAMSVLGAPAARGVIRRCLHSDDADVRAQAIEALDSIGDRRLGSALTRLVEHRPHEHGPALDETLGRLRDDDDPWIRALARRVHPAGGDMADSAPSVGHIETMLRLRRVPLFERLEPEDLQRIAMVARERAFGPGEALVREGELGDELFVILAGQVLVLRREADGTERVLRRYEAGDHIGELAVLRERPRAATVVADGDGVRSLVIDGEGLRAILRERPEAAMVMLATLAERISAQ